MRFSPWCLGGKVAVTVGGVSFPSVGGRPNVFSGKPHSVYIPRGHDYTFTALTDVEIGMPSAPSDLDTEPYMIAPDQVASGRWGAANFGRNFHQILTEIAQPELPASRLIVGETYTPSGNWSTFPPHRHKFDNLPAEAQHEEGYYFRVNPCRWLWHQPHVHGRGLRGELHDPRARHADDARGLPHGRVRPWIHHVLHVVPRWTGRTQGAVDDAKSGWVNRTVSMLRDLGH